MSKNGNVVGTRGQQAQKDGTTGNLCETAATGVGCWGAAGEGAQAP